MIDPFEIVAVDVLLRPERPLVERSLRALVRYRAFRSLNGTPSVSLSRKY